MNINWLVSPCFSMLARHVMTGNDMWDAILPWDPWHESDLYQEWSHRTDRWSMQYSSFSSFARVYTSYSLWASPRAGLSCIQAAQYGQELFLDYKIMRCIMYKILLSLNTNCLLYIKVKHADIAGHTVDLLGGCLCFDVFECHWRSLYTTWDTITRG